MTKEQIETLYQFTSKHFVEHYDLQTELVDHLANGIEKTREDRPGLTFQEALQSEFKKFGVFGFHDVIEKHRAAMNKRYLKIIMGYVKSFFRLPKLLMTVALLMGYYTVLHYVSGQLQYYFVVITAWSIFLFLIVKTVILGKKQKAKPKKWLLEEIIFNQMAFLNFMILPIHFINFMTPDSLESQLAQLVFSFGAVLYILLVYSMTILIPQNAEKFLLETYPEYGIN